MDGETFIFQLKMCHIIITQHHRRRARAFKDNNKFVEYFCVALSSSADKIQNKKKFPNDNK
jgi:hypothetical protein